jgi:hypothetical protein
MGLATEQNDLSNLSFKNSMKNLGEGEDTIEDNKSLF